MAVFLETNLHINNVKAHLGPPLGWCAVQLAADERNARQFAKILAHNLCVLIASMYELGIDPTFRSKVAVAPKVAALVDF